MSRLPTFTRGQSVADWNAEEFRGLVDTVRELREWMETTKRLHLPGLARLKQAPEEVEAELAVKVTYFHSMRTSPYGGFLYCVDDTADLAIATPSGEWFSVALPYMLRAWPWSVLGRPWVDVAGYSEPLWTYVYDRVANRVATRTSDGLEEPQTITPSYTRGDPLLIAKVPSQAVWSGGEDPESTWLDFNIDARSWARVDDS